jgi:hypothetical protein
LNTRRIHKISSVCKCCRCSATVTMVRMRAEFVGPLGSHGRDLQTIEPRLRIVLCVYNVQEYREGSRRFITVFTRALRITIQSIIPYSIYVRSLLILFSHLRLRLHSGLCFFSLSHQNPVSTIPKIINPLSNQLNKPKINQTVPSNPIIAPVGSNNAIIAFLNLFLR